MHGKFNHTAKIISGGTALEVTGPVSWDADELGAVIHARVIQGDMVASGASAFTSSNADTWSATLTAHDGTSQPGTARARANATVSLKDGHTEPYNWPDEIELIN